MGTSVRSGGLHHQRRAIGGDQRDVGRDALDALGQPAAVVCVEQSDQLAGEPAVTLAALRRGLLVEGLAQTPFGVGAGDDQLLLSSFDQKRLRLPTLVLEGLGLVSFAHVTSSQIFPGQTDALKKCVKDNSTTILSKVNS